ncbi:MAG: Rieske (2Fe-2S) protein [Acidobacteria bacterium]|nr:Rieske (2Fe-2S) protein [Acidobacteriota bacterium]
MRFLGKLLRRGAYQPTLPGLQVPRRAHRAAGDKGDGARGGRPGLRLVTESISRRTFLSGTLAWITAAIVSAVGAPVATALIWPAFQKSKGDWSPVARLDNPGPNQADLSAVDKPILTHFTALVQDAYLEAAPQNMPVFVVNHGKGQFTIFDVRCTHLGCPVNWDQKTKKFYSPCHDGVFDSEGRVLAGPPPRPLDRYEFKVEKGVLYAGKLFKVDDSLRRVTS